MRRTVVGASTLRNPWRLAHISAAPTVVASDDNQTSTRKLIQPGDNSSLATSLSGGNLQKFIVGRETQLSPRIMVVAQPTWGVDIGASMLIRQAIIDLRDQGVAVLVLSEELEELFMMSDRIAVLADGRLSQAVPLASTSVNQIGVWMSGNLAAPNEEASDHVAA